MQNDIYNSVARLEKGKKNLLSFNNGKVSCDFLDKMILLGLSTVRVSTMSWHVHEILKFKDDVEVKKWTREDVEKIIGDFQKKDWSSETRERFTFVLRRFVSFAKQGIIVEKKNNDEYSPECAWIQPSNYRRKNDDSTLANRKGFDEDEILQLLKVIPEISHYPDRDYLFIEIGYEAGLRTAELILLRLKDLEIDNKRKIAYLIVKSGKSSARKIPLIMSYRKIVDFIASHPFASKPDAFLFPGRLHKENHIPYVTATNVIKDACRKANLPVKSLYKLRHSRITSLLLSQTPLPIIQKISGHRKGETIRVYTSLIQSDVDSAVMIDRGLAPEKKNESKIKMISCPNCHRVEDPLAQRCGSCGSFLSQMVALKFDSAREYNQKRFDKKYNSEIKDLRSNFNELKSLVMDLKKELKKESREKN